MRVTIPVWKDCVSSTFDAAHRLLLVDIQNGSATNRSEISFSGELIPQKLSKLKSLGVDVSICGAISHSLASQVGESGIEVLPYELGPVVDILKSYMTGQLNQPRFAMPY